MMRKSSKGISIGGFKRDKPLHSLKLRSVAKKGGRGQFAWGAPGDEVDIPPIDKDDPCYESADEDNYILISREERDADAARRVGINSRVHRDARTKNLYTRDRTRSNDALIPPKMKLTDFKKRIVSILREYFSSEDVSDAAKSLKSLDCPAFHYEFVKRAVTMSIDRKDREREAVSRLISSLYPSHLSSVQIGKGFERLFERSEELEIDAPNFAKDAITKFLCRAVTDEILPPSFLTDPFVESLGGSIVDNAKTVLTQKHSFARLERVWGVSSNQTPVTEIKRTMQLIVEEYLVGEGDIMEATRCLKGLDVPYFHHEFVMKLLRTGMDGKEGGRRSQKVIRLMKWLRDQEVISEKQFEIGFERLKKRMENDVVLDVGPVARVMMNSFEKQFFGGGGDDVDDDDDELSAVKRAARASGARRTGGG